MRATSLRLLFLRLLIFLPILALLSCNNNGPAGPAKTPAKTGDLRLEITGLTAGIKANVAVSGPSNFSKTFDSTVTLTRIPVGEYVVTAKPVITPANDTVKAAVETQKVTVSAGTTKTVTVQYVALQFGSLALTISGLPSGETGYVRVYKSGENTYDEVTLSARIDKLTPGSYKIVAYGIVANSGIAYVPDVDTQTVAVNIGAVTNIAIVYKEKYGQLQVNVTGLPAGETGSIRVYRSDWNPQNGEYFDVSKSVLLDSLFDGLYHVDAVEITLTTGAIYRPEHYFQQIQVSPGKTAVMEVHYFPKYGSLDLVIKGLPTGVDGKVTITSQLDPTQTWTLTASDVLDSLEEGTYTLRAFDVYGPDSTLYRPDVIQANIDIRGGQTTNTTVIYKSPYGKMDVTVTGLPAEVPADVTVDGPSGTTLFTYHSLLVDSLLEGDYTVVAREVTGTDGTPYIAKPDSQQVVVSGGQITSVTVKYVPKFGKLDVLVNGLPSDVMSSIHITGPGYDMTHWNLRQQVLDSLQEGDFKVIGKEVMGPDFTNYVAKPDTQVVKVTAGETAYVTVNYEHKYGILDITVTGLPDGALSIVDIRNKAGGKERYLNSSHIVMDTLAADFYWVIGKEVKAPDGTPWVARPDTQKVYVTPGDTTFVTVHYVLSLGALKVDVTGLPEGVSGNIVIRNQDFSQLWSITGTEVIDSMPEGVYTVLAHEVVDLDGDTLKAIPDSTNVTITAGDSASVAIKYNGLTFRVFSGLPPGIMTGEILTNYDNVGSVLTRTTHDSALIRPLEYDDCRLTAVDITDSGYTESISGSLGDGSFLLTHTLAISKLDRSFELTTQSVVSAGVPASTYGGSVGVNLLAPGGPFVQIDNPNLDSIEVVIRWDVTGTQTATSVGNQQGFSEAHSYLRIFAGSCYTNLTNNYLSPFNAHADNTHNDDNMPVSGDTTIVIKNSPFSLLWFSLYSSLKAGSFQHDQNDGRDGEGSGSGEMTVVISVAINKY